MRIPKLRGNTSKDAMPVGPFRTRSWAVNVSALDRFDDEVTPEALASAGLIRNTRLDVKILGHGDLTKKLTVSAHSFSKTAREKIEAAGGSVVWLRGEPEAKKTKRRSARPAAAPDPEEAAEDTPEEPAE
jgi:large subunit ribosomal protein L15